ncbi:MAG TPA: SIR2 family protein [Streptosporangiaceae bacterium]|nr:SIR2 family protein [Streptosporangiaceae bacterium]
MGGDSYLDGLTPEQAAELTRVNEPGLTALRGYLASDRAAAFLGAGVSAPLYPLWTGLIGDLIDAAASRLDDGQAETLRALASQSPEEVVEIVRNNLGTGAYREVLRQVFRVRTDEDTGRSWTPVQELVCRCAFQAVVTTNYDPGIVDARMRVRPDVSSTGFTTWEDELELDQWRTGDVFGRAKLPVLFAHGLHSRPDSIVLATTEYRRAYAGKLPSVLARLLDGHLVWLGFSFTDQRIAAILREVADRTGTRIDPGAAPRHVAIMSWNPTAEANDPGTLARRAEIAYGAKLILYPAPNNDHSALARLLADLTDERFPPVVGVPATVAASPALPVKWVPEAERLEHFTGRTEELARLDRWAADPQVRLVAVTAWGGAGKTALVTRWIQDGGAARRPGIRGVFAWSFYANPSAEQWAKSLLDWASQKLGIAVAGARRPAEALLALLRGVPLLLVLDGLEVVQESPAGDGFGRLLDGALRETLSGACRLEHGGLVLLTSRFPFADLEGFDGSSARMLEIPAFTPAEGAALLAAAGGEWLPEDQRQDLVRAVDGHALATGVLAGLLADHLPADDLAALRAELSEATRTDVRVSKVLVFYAARLSDADRYLLAAVSLFAQPVDAGTVLTVTRHVAFGSRLAGWTPMMVRAAVRGPLAGLASWHPEGTISAHPLVRDAFRPLVMAAAGIVADIALAEMPAGTVTSRVDALRAVEVIELLLDANQWRAANSMYQNRCDNGAVWRHLPAARLGQRAATAFVATPAQRTVCVTQLDGDRFSYYVNDAGLFAVETGDLTTAWEYLSLGARYDREAGDKRNLNVSLRNMADCLGHLGRTALGQETAAESLACAKDGSYWPHIRNAHSYLGWFAALVGDMVKAEEHFLAADQIQVSLNPKGKHLYSLSGIWWADHLARTGRQKSAWALTMRNIEVCRGYDWNQDVARCDRMLGRLALAAQDAAAAGDYLIAAAAAFRDGDFLTELTSTLVDLAEHARVSQDLEAAEHHTTEAITIAAPRGLVQAHCAALAIRARVRATRANAGESDLLYSGRDAADAALRLAIRHQFAWHEFDALRAHAFLDQVEAIDRGWSAQADALHARLVPPGLDPDPLGTVERLVAAEKATKKTRRTRTDGRLLEQRAGRHSGRGRPDPDRRGRARYLPGPGQPSPGAGPVGQPDRGHPSP